SVHVVACKESDRVFFRSAESMSCVARDSSLIDNPDWGQHRAGVFVQEHVISDGPANDLQGDPLCLQSGCVRSAIIALDGRIIHEVEFEVARSPIAGHSPNHSLKISPSTRMSSIEDEKGSHVAVCIDQYRFSFGVVD